MIVYRLSRAKYAEDLSGIGAEMNGGRWNTPGVKVLYTAQSIALANLEVAVHLPFELIPEDYMRVTLEFPDYLTIKEIAHDDLRNDWKNQYNGTQQIGDYYFLNKNIFCLKVPSAVAKGEWNYLLNPIHKDFKKVFIKDIEPFAFDSRLFNR